MDSSELTTAYKDKILGIRNYKSNKPEFRVQDFMDEKELHLILGEVSTGESDLTPAGKSFLEKHYGYSVVATILFKRCQETKSSEFNNQSEEKIQQWLEGIVPMEVYSFISQAKGKSMEGTTLREDLLPPNAKAA